MEGFVKGDVVVVPFPFSDLSDAKLRPALVLTSLDGYDMILCQITSQKRRDSYSIMLTDEEFETGRLNRTSIIRPNRIFTADRSIIKYRAGHLKTRKQSEILEQLRNIFGI
jgi:mRNA interferase MazF